MRTELRVLHMETGDPRVVQVDELQIVHLLQQKMAGV
jgi:hypothetical protein